MVAVPEPLIVSTPVLLTLTHPVLLLLYVTVPEIELPPAVRETLGRLKVAEVMFKALEVKARVVGVAER